MQAGIILRRGQRARARNREESSGAGIRNGLPWRRVNEHPKISI